MERRKLIRLMSSAAAIAFMPGLAGCVVERTVYRPTPAPRPRYQPPDQYSYFYYPDVAVYFHITTGYYWYFIHGSWRRALRLPHHIHLRGPRHKFVNRDDYPYRHYHDHRRRYGRPHKGHGPSDNWRYDRDGRGGGHDDDNQGNGQDRRRGDNDGQTNGRDRRQRDDRNGNRGTGQNNNRPWGNEDDHNNSPSRDQNQNQNNNRPWGNEDDHNNSPTRDQNNNQNNNRPWGNEDDHNNSPTRDKGQNSEQPPLQPQQQKDNDRGRNKPEKDKSDRRGDNGRGQDGDNGKKKGDEEEVPWIKKPKPDDQ